MAVSAATGMSDGDICLADRFLVAGHHAPLRRGDIRLWPAVLLAAGGLARRAVCRAGPRHVRREQSHGEQPLCHLVFPRLNTCSYAALPVPRLDARSCALLPVLLRLSRGPSCLARDALAARHLRCVRARSSLPL